ncbi:MAG: GNAT family N-acetyltransferase, partial [Candidatus Eisenbacteria bacterium]
MSVEYGFLSRELMPATYRAFMEAFSDYGVDMSRVTEDVFNKRATKNGIDYGCSVGAYDSGRMVGFTLVGVDAWMKELCAFDIATGVVKAHRGRGLAKGMFDALLPGLRAGGVKRLVLEVLRDNRAALKAYEKIGFRVTREFECFEVSSDSVGLRKTVVPGLEIGPVSLVQVSQFEPF